MKLFENITKINYDNFWHRYYDTELKKSVFERVQVQDEFYFRTQGTTEFTSFLDGTPLKLETSNKSRRDYEYKANKPFKFIRDMYWGLDSNTYNSNPRGFYLDIETRSGVVTGKEKYPGFPEAEHAEYEIVTIQIYDNIDDMYYMITDKSCSKRFNKLHPEFSNTIWIVHENEKDRINAFTDLLKEKLPFFCTAWNGNNFDFPYLYNRMINIGLSPSDLSPLKKCKLHKKEYGHVTTYELQADGIFFIDLMEVYKKFVVAPRSSYAIDNIAEIEIQEKKVDHSEYEKFDDFYQGNYKLPFEPTEEQRNSEIYKIQKKYEETKEQKYLDMVKQLSWDEFLYYSIKDTVILYKIDKVISLTSMMIGLSEKMGILFSDALGTVKPWGNYINNVAWAQKKIITTDKPGKEGSNKGGYVRDTIKGRYKWIVSVDVNSMYPLLSMVAQNMSAETYIPAQKLPKDLREIVVKYFMNEEEDDRLELPENIWEEYRTLLKKYNFSGSATGAIFDKSKQGMISKLVHDIYKDRKKMKKQSFVHKRNALAIKEELHKRGIQI